MTDITELAQRLKLEVHRAVSDFNPQMNIKTRDLKALVEALEKAQRVDEELCKLLPLGAEYMDPPDGGDVTPLEGVRRMVADYRQRIAEQESRTVKLPKLKMLEDYLAEVAIEERKQILVGVKLEFHRACVAAGIKVEAE
ncbi:phage EaA protein [Klebsiella pneumoniae]|uniref:hypothetical protein n=1 Tax=Klebsiella pneumoniae TaxID=573 RepID=UPI0007CC1F12|nr:hypothetical protein [Klebsiella pneumoniae]SBK57625.1 phage EaA protein [Klebsiella pneumoniae]